MLAVCYIIVMDGSEGDSMVTLDFPTVFPNWGATSVAFHLNRSDVISAASLLFLTPPTLFTINKMEKHGRLPGYPNLCYSEVKQKRIGNLQHYIMVNGRWTGSYVVLL